MGFHHLAIATRDSKATHAFYTEAMGFSLAKVEVGKTPEGGWAKHFFYETGGGGMIAFWEIHDSGLPEDWKPALSEGLGLPRWANHIAFAAADEDDLARKQERWLSVGHDVVWIDHGWCISIYTVDPNRTMVEFCLTTREFTDEDRTRALELLQDPNPPLGDEAPTIRVFRAGDAPAAA